MQKIASVFGLGIFLLLVTSVATMISYQNSAARLKNEFHAQEQKIEATLDDTWKTIQQTAQVDDKYQSNVKELIVGNAEARGGGGGLASFVTEAVPNIDPTTANRLISIISARRELLKREQMTLAAVARQYNNLADTFPSSLFVNDRLEARIISSTKTKQAVESGVDDNIALYEVQ